MELSPDAAEVPLPCVQALVFAYISPPFWHVVQPSSLTCTLPLWERDRCRSRRRWDHPGE